MSRRIDMPICATRKIDQPTNRRRTAGRVLGGGLVAEPEPVRELCVFVSPVGRPVDLRWGGSRRRQKQPDDSTVSGGAKSRVWRREGAAVGVGVDAESMH